MSKIIIDPLEKAVKRLEEAISLPLDDIVRDACVQRFEYTYELSWKILKRFLKDVYNQDEAIFLKMFKKAGKLELIEDPLAWYNFRQARNHALHNYFEIGADFSYSQAKLFLEHAKKLVSKLQQINNQITDE